MAKRRQTFPKVAAVTRKSRRIAGCFEFPRRNKPRCIKSHLQSMAAVAQLFCISFGMLVRDSHQSWKLATKLPSCRIRSHHELRRHLKSRCTTLHKSPFIAIDEACGAILAGRVFSTTLCALVTILVNLMVVKLITTACGATLGVSGGR